MNYEIKCKTKTRVEVSTLGPAPEALFCAICVSVLLMDPPERLELPDLFFKYAY